MNDDFSGPEVLPETLNEHLFHRGGHPGRAEKQGCRKGDGDHDKEGPQFFIADIPQEEL